MPRLHQTLRPLLAASILLTGCAPLLKPEGADAARQQLAALRADAVLAPEVQAALVDADLAVLAAEVPTRDAAAGRHAVHIASRKVEIARAQAERQVAERALQALNRQREAILEEGQRQELEIARAQAEAAAAAAMEQQRLAAAALIAAAEARATTEALRQEMQGLQAEATDRGMVMTLGDVLFATGKADLQPAAMDRLDKLAVFMNRYVDRTLLIEGHTDAQGSDEKNRPLSERRAEAVKVYLIIQSVDSARMHAIGLGSGRPLADNLTAEGRQRNRRVEIVIRNADTKP
ncbi:MAG: OmpA family protein [Pseudomonadota bacterium]